MARSRQRSFGRLGVVTVAVATCLVAPTASTASAGTGSIGDRDAAISFGRFDPQLGDFSLWTARADGTHQRRLTTMPSYFSSWRPDGARIAFDFADEAGVHIATIRPDGTGLVRLTSAPGIQEVPRYSPDGRHIVFDASSLLPDDPAFHTDIWVMDADGSHPHQVTSGAFDVEPAFSPDGWAIVFGRIVGSTDPQNFLQDEAVYVVHVDGSGLREVVPPRPALEHPRWAPSGRMITFNIAPEAEGAPGAGTVYSVHLDGHDLRPLRRADERWFFTKAVWLPDSQGLVVVCHRIDLGADNLCTMDPSGGHLTLIVRGTQERPVNFPSWGPR